MKLLRNVDLIAQYYSVSSVIQNQLRRFMVVQSISHSALVSSWDSMARSSTPVMEYQTNIAWRAIWLYSGEWLLCQSFAASAKECT